MSAAAPVVQLKDTGSGMKIVCISDTHNRHREVCFDTAASGDVLVHAGDFTNFGSLKEVRDFVQWFAGLEGFRHKVLIAGNHDVGMDPDYDNQETGGVFVSEEDRAEIARLVCHNPAFHYLHDSSVVLDGVKFYGAPYVCLDMSAPTRWAFSLTDMQIVCKGVWERIPDDTDVLITHGPPYSILDRSYSGHVGDDFLLLQVIQRVRPQVHIFGHVHNQQGVETRGSTRFVNAVSQAEYDAPMLQPVVLYGIRDASSRRDAASALLQVASEPVRIRVRGSMDRRLRCSASASASGSASASTPASGA